MLIMGAMCYRLRDGDDKAYTNRAKAMLEEIVRLKEQEAALRSEMARIIKLRKVNRKWVQQVLAPEGEGKFSYVLVRQVLEYLAKNKHLDVDFG